MPPGGLPHPARCRPNLPNNHLQYALTWYGLALVLIAVFAVWAVGRRRQRRANGRDLTIVHVISDTC